MIRAVQSGIKDNLGRLHACFKHGNLLCHITLVGDLDKAKLLNCGIFLRVFELTDGLVVEVASWQLPANIRQITRHGVREFLRHADIIRKSSRAIYFGQAISLNELLARLPSSEARI